MQRIELAILAYTKDGAALGRRIIKTLGDDCVLFLHDGHAAGTSAHTGGGRTYDAKDATHVTRDGNRDDRTDNELAGANQCKNEVLFSDTKELIADLFERTDAILYISATGIAIRTVAEFLRSKTDDPAILSMDDTATYVIPLLSGHLGGANAWANRIAAIFGAEAVITTATDRHGTFAVDLYAKEYGLGIDHPGMIKEISGALLAQVPVGFACEEHLKEVFPFPTGTWGEGLYKEQIKDTEKEWADIGIVITDDAFRPAQFLTECRLYPRDLCLGIGCKKGKRKEELEAVIKEVLTEAGIPLCRIRKIASVDVKKEEAGIRELARSLRAEFVTFSAEELMKVAGEFTPSDFVKETVGTDNVCERSAVCASQGEIVVRKVAKDGVTAAVCKIPMRG
ncbi:MAG: cobalamin biosynthesis protein [Lachnospiraceae bacterium]|nr:cobalamin biosynthesis protein [Lachnospiraceae bacterium]